MFLAAELGKGFVMGYSIYVAHCYVSYVNVNAKQVREKFQTNYSTLQSSILSLYITISICRGGGDPIFLPVV